MQVPFLDLKAQHAVLEGELTEAFRAIVRGAAFVGGPEVEAFEREFAAFCHADGAVGVGSGTDALRFAYLAMGIKPGDEVITVPNTFIATTEALTQAGAVVRFVDVLPDTLLMDPRQLAAAITTSRVTTAVSTPSRPRSCGSSCGAWSSGIALGAPSRRYTGGGYQRCRTCALWRRRRAVGPCIICSSCGCLSAIGCARSCRAE